MLEARKYAHEVVIQDWKTKKVYKKSYHAEKILHCAMNIENKLGAGIIKLQPAAVV